MSLPKELFSKIGLPVKEGVDEVTVSCPIGAVDRIRYNPDNQESVQAAQNSVRRSIVCGNCPLPMICPYYDSLGIDFNPWS